MTGAEMPKSGDFVRVRTRRWLVEDERSAGEGLTALRLACVDDDAQGEVVEVLWDAELDGSVLKDEGWASVAKLGTDDPSVFSALAPLEYRDCRRSGPVPSSVQGRHPPGRLSDSSTAEGPAPSTGQSADC
jgi:hypothetical protein